jgi:hypothetical protein
MMIADEANDANTLFIEYRNTQRGHARRNFYIRPEKISMNSTHEKIVIVTAPAIYNEKLSVDGVGYGD